MHDGWTRTRFIDAVDFREGPGILAKDFRESGVPLIRLAGLERGASLLSGCNLLCPQMVAQKWSHFAVAEGDVLLSTSGSLGRIAIVASIGVGGIPYTGIIRLRPKSNLLDRSFLRYVLEAPDFQRQAETLGVGSVIRHFGPTHLREMALTLPPLIEQRAIASVLGALDDKIDLNRRMCQTLEEMARALFKSWFVEKPRPTWRTAPLGEWVVPLSGGTPSKADASLWGGPLKWISPKAMTSIHADECEDHVTAYAVGRGTRIAVKGSTLVMVRGMGLHDGVRVSQAREDVTFNQDVKALVPKHIHPDLLLFAILDAQSALHQRVESSGHGTGKLPSELLLAHPITMPALEEQAKLGVTITEMNDRIAIARRESRALVALRDTLLPKLISGEVRVPASLGSMQEVTT